MRLDDDIRAAADTIVNRLEWCASHEVVATRIGHALQLERERCAKHVDAYAQQAERVSGHEYAGNLDELNTLLNRIRSGEQP